MKAQNKMKYCYELQLHGSSIEGGGKDETTQMRFTYFQNVLGLCVAKVENKNFGTRQDRVCSHQLCPGQAASAFWIPIFT